MSPINHLEFLFLFSQFLFLFISGFEKISIGEKNLLHYIFYLIRNNNLKLHFLSNDINILKSWYPF